MSSGQRCQKCRLQIGPETSFPTTVSARWTMLEHIFSALRGVRRVGSEWQACCPAHDDSEPSLSIREAENGRVLVHCHGGCSQEAVISELRALGVWPKPSADGIASHSNRKSIDRRPDPTSYCSEIWAQCLEVTEDAVDPLRAYLKARGLDSKYLPECIRLHPNHAYMQKGKPVSTHPTMVARISDQDGDLIGLGRTFLGTGGHKANVAEPRKSLGRVSGGAIRLDVPGETLALAEGLETALAIRQATELPTWSAVSASNLKKVSIPESVCTVHVFADKDGSSVGQNAALQLCSQLYRQKKTVYLHIPSGQIPEGKRGIDWLDILVSEGTAAFENTLQETKPWKPMKKSAKSDQEPTQSQILIDLAADSEFFSSPDQVFYVTFPVGQHNETWPVKSKTFRLWLTHRFYEAKSKPPSSQALQSTLVFLEAKARFEGPTHPVFTRVAEHKGRIYLDLADDEWHAVEVTGRGWKITSDPPCKFRRSAGVLPLPFPEEGGCIEELRELLNCSSQENWILLLAWLLASLRPRGPYFVLILYGEQGSSKSFLERLLRSLIDPSIPPVRTAPKDERDLMIGARHHWILALDNLSHVPEWLSDALCRLSTGGGLATRRLYTDDEEEIFDATRPSVLNSIEPVVTRADLVDRGLIVDLPQIPDERRRPEKEILAEFDRMRPRILGALLDAVSTGLRNLGTVNLNSLPRMADAARWIVACEPALPLEEGEFLRTYQSNRAGAVEDTLEADPVATAVRAFMEGLHSWEGTPTELLDELEGVADERTKNSKAWPKIATWLSRRLKRSATFLRSVGIEIELPGQGKSGKKRLIRIRTDCGKGSDGKGPIDGKNDTPTLQTEIPTASKPANYSLFDGIDGIDDKKPTQSSETEEREVLEI